MDDKIDAGATVKLTPSEREIAIGLLGSRGLSSPEETAKNLLAGIAVLDGKHSPFVIWPAEVTLRQRAEWHAQKAAYWAESADRFDARMGKFNSDEGQSLEEPGRSPQGPSESDETAPYPASTAPVHPEVDKGNPLPSGQTLDRDASDVC